MNFLILGLFLIFSVAARPVCAESPAVTLDSSLTVLGQPIYSSSLLTTFYEHRDNEFAWSKDKKFIPAVDDLLKALRESEREGLRPEDYHVNIIQGMLNTIDAEGAQIPLSQFGDLDMLLTDAFLTYGTHLLSGSINPYSIDDEWFADRRTGDLPSVLEDAMKFNKVPEMLESLLPNHPIYKRMRAALARYRKIEETGGWNTIPAGPAIKKGKGEIRVPFVKLRLEREGYWNEPIGEDEFFNSGLERAVKKFQQDHGLEADGVLGESTVAEMNVPVELRVRQLRLNMERCRWLPADLGRRHIFVNVPDFSLHVIEDNKSVLEMRVIVGRKMRRTPVFSSVMNQVVLNPSWTVTKNVATTDLLQHIQEEPGYLQKFGFDVYENYDDNAPPIDPTTINWSSMTAQTLPFKFRQRPGPLNALGQIKFLFPNRFDVYLHDTASRSLFDKHVRDFSSGCIRVQKPIDLAEYVFRGDPVWTRENLLKALKSGGNEQYISLKEPIPVHLMYWTAWVDENGDVQFRDDIYGRDEPLNHALHPG